MNTDVLIADMSGVYGTQRLPEALEAAGIRFKLLDFKDMEGTSCYCSPASETFLREHLPEPLPPVRWIDSGDYHYLSCILASLQKAPFHFVLLDNHPDNQDSAFGPVLSCGNWMKRLEGNPFLRSSVTIGPEGCEAPDLDEWMAERSGERLYISLDKDIMGKDFARTDWSQGSYTLDEVKGLLEMMLCGPMECVAVDICGELSDAKGAGERDRAVNLATNLELLKTINNHITKH